MNIDAKKKRLDEYLNNFNINKQSLFRYISYNKMDLTDCCIVKEFYDQEGFHQICKIVFPAIPNFNFNVTTGNKCPCDKLSENYIKKVFNQLFRLYEKEYSTEKNSSKT